jgi:O-antigen/teichoic acid export membrane protein
VAVDPVNAGSGKDAAIRRHVARSTGSNLIGQVVILGTGFLLSPFVLGRVGASDYGLWVLVTSLTGYASVLEFGISTAVVKYVAEYRTRGERSEAAALVATALSLYTVLGLLAVAVSVILAMLLPRIIQIPPGDEDKAVRLVLLAGVGLGISIPATTVVAVLRGLQRFDLLNLLYVINTLFSAAATIAVLLLGWGVVGIAVAAIPVTILTQLPGLYLIRRADPQMQLGWRGARLGLVRTVTGFSFSLFAMQVARQLILRTDELVIATSLPIRSVTPYSFGRRLGEIPNLLANQFIRTLMPLASGFHAAADWNRLRALFVSGIRLALAISMPIAVILSVLGSSLLSVWIGAEYAAYWPVVLLISLSSVAMISLYPAGSLLQGMAKHHILAITSIVTGIFNVALSFFLVRRVGLIGVAVGTLVPALLEALVVMPYTMRVIGVDRQRVLKEGILPAFLPTVPMTLVLYGLHAAISLPSARIPALILLGVLAAIGAAVYLAVYLAFPAAAAERGMARSFLLRAVTIAKSAFRPG